MTRISALFSLALGCALAAAADSVRLDELDLHTGEQDYSDPHANLSVDYKPMTIGTKHFAHGYGAHANSSLFIDLKGTATRFMSSVGVDGEVPQGKGSVEFVVMGDGKILWRSGVMRGQEPAKLADVNLTGVKKLSLLVNDGGDGIDHDHADWADGAIEYSGAKPETITGAPPEPAEILTPAPAPAPRINGPAVFGVRPGHPLLYRVPVTGQRPMKISIEGLPDGLTFDPARQIISGQLTAVGPHPVTIHAENAAGRAAKKFKIMVGDTLALTPPLGWNSWNCFAGNVDAAKIRLAADAMVRSGLIEHGWMYINIDDTWEAGRDAAGNIEANAKFPDMKGLADYVHGLGLKIGLYSSPGPKTCANYEGSWQHEEQDARQYAAWGYDYLKYDWCSYGNVVDKSQPQLTQWQKPYQVMNAGLRAQDRDIVFSLCQYGMGDVWKWGAEVGGNCWRTTGDIRDSWGSLSANGFSSAGHETYAGPGHWNDPDMLVVGNLGWGSVRPCHLTPSEQYTHLSLWCLLDSPLLIGCDMSHLDDFTKSLLSNDEVLDVNQDELGRQAARVSQAGKLEVWAKDMADGSKAVGLFNRDDAPAQVTVKWSDLGWTGAHRVRDLWRQADLGPFSDAFTQTIPRHGSFLVRVQP
ncbi:MAG TPA: NPCBM/NEW2 domain-containing protein [Verrucomicrobiae bacterium]|nr:NPCBM/NEW2 domain-containing protein [Verrucomicrobiae bacterium]